MSASSIDFTPAEFKDRLKRAQARMRADDIDALLLCSEAEFRYFSGFRSLFWKSPTRCWYLIVPQNSAPIAVIPHIGADLMQRTWVKDIRTFASPHAQEQDLPLLIEALQGYQRIGLPMGEETSLNMPLSRLFRLQESIKGKFCDATPLIKALRMVKSSAEIAIISEICDIGGRAFARAKELFHPNQPLKEAFRRFTIALLEEGADSVEYLVGAAHSEGHANIISPPDETLLALGDVLMLDTGSVLKGYYCDFDRNFALGHANDKLKRAYALLWEATEAGLATAKAGVQACDVFQAMNSVIKANVGQVGRFGHGLGMQLTEWPSLAPHDTTILQENMVITLEPSCIVDKGRIMVMEENILIMADKALCLTSRAEPELPIL